MDSGFTRPRLINHHPASPPRLPPTTASMFATRASSKVANLATGSLAGSDVERAYWGVLGERQQLSALWNHPPPVSHNNSALGEINLGVQNVPELVPRGVKRQRTGSITREAMGEASEILSESMLPQTPSEVPPETGFFGDFQSMWGPPSLQPSDVPLVPDSIHTSVHLTAATESKEALRHLYSLKRSPLPELVPGSLDSWKKAILSRAFSDSYTIAVFFEPIPTPSGGYLWSTSLDSNSLSFFDFSVCKVGEMYFHSKEHFFPTITGILEERLDIPKQQAKLIKLSQNDYACHLNLSSVDSFRIKYSERLQHGKKTYQPHEQVSDADRIADILYANARAQAPLGKLKEQTELIPPGFQAAPNDETLAYLLEDLKDRAAGSPLNAKRKKGDDQVKISYASKELCALMTEIARFGIDTRVLGTFDQGWAESGLASYAAAVMQLGLLLIATGFLTPMGLVGLSESKKSMFAGSLDYQTSWRRLLIRWISKKSIEKGLASYFWTSIDRKANKDANDMQKAAQSEEMGQPLAQNILAEYLDNIAISALATPNTTYY